MMTDQTATLSAPNTAAQLRCQRPSRSIQLLPVPSSPNLKPTHLLFRPAAKIILAIVLLAAGLFISGCDGSTPTPTPTHVPTATRPLPTAVPPTATPAPLGSSENPILIGVVLSTQAAGANPTAENPTLQPSSAAATPTQATTTPGNPIGQPTGSPAPGTPQATATQVVVLPDGTSDDLAKLVSDKTGYTVQTVQFGSYAELIEALNQHKIHAGWLPPLTYLLAYQRGIAQVGLVSNHFGVYAYGTQFLANAEDQYTVYFDSAKNQSTADAADALRQFAGKRPCWVDPTSASGYVLPKGVLAVESIHPGAEIITQDHTAVIRALYTRGICDFGATFGIMGDPRTASTVQKDLPDVMQKVIIIWQTPAVIPNLNLSYAWDLPQPVRTKLDDALISLAQSKDGLAALSASTGYQIDGLKQAGNDFYNDLMYYVQASGVELSSLVGR